MQRASSRKKEVFMKNKSEFFIKPNNYSYTINEQIQKIAQ